MLKNFFVRPRDKQIWPVGTHYRTISTTRCDSPTLEDIISVTSTLTGANRALPLRFGSNAFRTEEHCVNWAYNHAKVESIILNREFVKADHRFFDTDLLVSSDGIECSIQFRLQTVGLIGATFFRIAWRKIGDDQFQCSE
jgi:hypothetical protein